MVQAVWSTAHGASAADDRPRRRADLPARCARRPDPRALRAALVALAEPATCCSSSRRSRSRSARCPSSGWRASTSARGAPALGFALAYLLYPATQWLTLNEFHPVALAARCCCSRSGTSTRTGCCRSPLFALARGRVQGGDRARRRGLRGLVRDRAQATRRRSGDRARRSGVGARSRSPSSSRTSTPAPSRTSTPATARSAARRGHPEDGGRASAAHARSGLRARATFTTCSSSSLPLAALCLLAPLVLVAALPELALNLLSSTPTQTSIHFHYTAGADRRRS